MRGRLAEVVTIVVASTAVTMAMAAPVLQAPSDRIFGHAMVGWHHDPLTVMAQFERPIRVGVHTQPVTDIPGTLLARIFGGVAAYNWLVLLSFPLSAAAAYLLARYLTLSPAGAAVAAMAYAFSPFHIAHAAYHPHVAQTQWIPLYLLALWRCLDRGSPASVAALGGTAVAVVLSNFYGGLIAAVVTPTAVAAHWLVQRTHRARSIRRLVITLGTLVCIGAAGMVYALSVARPVVASPAAFAFPRADLVRYSAAPVSYLMPPVQHPVLGAMADRFWNAAHVREGLLEQQVSLGWGVVTLGLIAVVGWLRRDQRLGSFASVPILAAVGGTALVCSWPPLWTIGAFSVTGPSGLLHEVAPMFRSYARFGVVVQLMAAVLAGVGVDYLRRTGSRRALIACVALVAVAAGEYAVNPLRLWRDVLPTAAHRWVVQQPDPVQALDCAPAAQAAASVQGLADDRIRPVNVTDDCTEPHLATKLAAARFTHLIVGSDTAAGHWFATHATPGGLQPVVAFADSRVFAITAEAPVVHTAAMTGFWPREHDGTLSWRWMGSDAAWTVENGSPRTVVADLRLEMAAFQWPRRMDVLFDGRAAQTLVVDPSRRLYHLGPFTIPPGHHKLAFHPAGPPTVATNFIANGDRRPLSFALGTWRWVIRQEQP